MIRDHFRQSFFNVQSIYRYHVRKKSRFASMNATSPVLSIQIGHELLRWCNIF